MLVVRQLDMQACSIYHHSLAGNNYELVTVQDHAITHFGDHYHNYDTKSIETSRVSRHKTLVQNLLPELLVG